MCIQSHLYSFYIHVGSRKQCEERGRRHKERDANSASFELLSAAKRKYCSRERRNKQKNAQDAGQMGQVRSRKPCRYRSWDFAVGSVSRESCERGR